MFHVIAEHQTTLRIEGKVYLLFQSHVITQHSFNCSCNYNGMIGNRLFRGKYLKDSIRLPGWNYRQPAPYFITICTKWRVPWFGNIRNQRMALSDIGCIADRCWRDIPMHFPGVTLDTHIVMPDHIHGIIIIHGTMPIMDVVETPHGASLQRLQLARRQWQPGCLGVVINHYKSAVSKLARRSGCADFMWQSRYHDRIIRDVESMERMRRYIKMNPGRWRNDA